MKEQQYYAFVIGYDLMNDFFQNSKFPESDIVFEECNDLAKRFMRSKYYQDTKKSSYEKLQEWVEDNKDLIKNHYNITQEKTKRKEREVR